MRIPFCIVVIAAASILSTAAPAPAESIKNREILGIRFGGVLTRGGMRNDFGTGSELELYFIEGLGSWYGINVSLSSHNMGESKDREKNIRFTGINREVDLSIYSITVALHVQGEYRDRLIPGSEAGIGMYTVTATIPAGVYEGHVSDNHLGFYGGVGVMVRLTKSVFINLSGKYHYIFSGGDDSHTIYFYTDEKRTHIFQISGGITIFTG